MLKWVLSAVLLFGIWVVLAGAVTSVTAVSGLLVVPISLVALRNLMSVVGWIGRPERLAAEADEPVSFRERVTVLWATIALGPLFLWKVLLSGLMVAFYAFKPTMDFWPGIVRVEGGMRTVKGTALFANLLTLTPGTLTIDYDEEGDALYVHWIDLTGYGEESFDRRVTSGLRPWLERLRL